MVTQNMLRTRVGKNVFCDCSRYHNKALNRLNYQTNYRCAPISELPYNLSTMNSVLILSNTGIPANSGQEYFFFHFMQKISRQKAYFA